MNKRIFKFLHYVFCFILIINNLLSIAFSEKVFKVEKINDVTVISNPKKPIPKNGLKKRIVFKEVLSIGEIEGDENYMFGGSVMFNTDEEANFYVSDFRNKRIQKYNAHGKYLLTIGRAGQGPGEFESLSGPRFDNDNNLYIYDVINKRVSFFDKNGKFLKQISTPENFDYISKTYTGYIIGFQYKYIEETATIENIIQLGIFDKEYKAIAILQEYEWKIIPPGGVDEDSIVKYWSNFFSKIVFTPNISFAQKSKNFIYCGYSDKYEINVYSQKGHLIKKIGRDYHPIPVSRKDRAVYIIKTRENSGILRKFSEDVREQILKNIKLPKYKPAYQKLVILENGWLAVIVDSIRNEYALIDLFAKEGRYVAQFKTDVPTSDLFFKNGKAYAVAEEEGFQFVKRYAIELQEYKNGKWVRSTIKLY